MITGETIKSAVAESIIGSEKLVELFNGKPRVHKEQIKQNLKLPAFFVWEYQVLQEKLMRDSYNRTSFIEVRHHLKEDDSDSNIYEKQAKIGNLLMSALSKIKVPDAIGIKRPVVGKDLEYKINDDVLIFLANYTIEIYLEEEDQPTMSELFINEI